MGQNGPQNANDHEQRARVHPAQPNYSVVVPAPELSSIDVAVRGYIGMITRFRKGLVSNAPYPAEPDLTHGLTRANAGPATNNTVIAKTTNPTKSSFFLMFLSSTNKSRMPTDFAVLYYLMMISSSSKRQNTAIRSTKPISEIRLQNRDILNPTYFHRQRILFCIRRSPEIFDRVASLAGQRPQDR